MPAVINSEAALRQAKVRPKQANVRKYMKSTSLTRFLVPPLYALNSDGQVESLTTQPPPIDMALVKNEYKKVA
jgi:hypothetical protein